MKDTRNQKVGKVIAVRGPVVDIEFEKAEDIPNLYQRVKTTTFNGREIVLEISEHLGNNIARCMALASTLNLQRNTKVFSLGDSVSVPVGKELFGRIINVVGQPIDNRGELKSRTTRVVQKGTPNLHLNANHQAYHKFEVLETGIKILDLLFPIIKGSKNGILGGAALGKTILVLELIYRIVKKHKGSCVFIGAGERIREGNELYYELKKQGVLDRVMMAFGQMNESPGARFEIVSTGITLAEYLQSQFQDVLLFIDNVYRFVQAGAEISTLLGRVPSETGYQPTLASEVGNFHEKISSRMGSFITAIEAIYVPADDITDSAVVTILSYLDSILVLSREKVQLGLYPAIDPLASSCSNLDPLIVGERHFKISQEVLKTLTEFKQLERIASIIGIEELSKSDQILYKRAKKLQNFLTQPFFTAEVYTGRKGEYVPLADTLQGCEMIISGRADLIPEEKLYMIGSLKETDINTDKKAD